MALDVEELLAQQVRVAHGHRRVDRRGVDVDVDLRRLSMRRIDHDGTGERREAAAHEREHRIAGHKLERRMSRIDLPRSGERKQVIAGVNVMIACSSDTLDLRFARTRSAMLSQDSGERTFPNRRVLLRYPQIDMLICIGRRRS